MRTEGQGNDGQGNETTRAGPLLGRCGWPISRANFTTLNAGTAHSHSVFTFSKPRKRNCRRPITDFRIPNGVSAIRGR